MSIPMLSYTPTSQNQRVAGYEVPGDEQPRIYTTKNLRTGIEMDALIQVAYRQIFNEQQLIKSNRQAALESQLRAGQITVRDFIKGLATSDSFQKRNYEVNNNYRFAQMCIQRILGREVYNEREKLAWSIVIATKGIKGFIDDLLNTEEYLDNFGDDTVPYQRRRILPQRFQGDLPFARMPRYGADHREQLKAMGYFKPGKPELRWQWQKPPYSNAYKVISEVVLATTAVLFTAGTIAVALAAWGIISL
ncbi:MAG: phycobilisome rod-core linker polypeptide [Cyanobacteria bacterium J06592_8]